ncbi:MAG: amidohydrolase family protein [Phycisphaerales bacterium]
MKVIRRIRSWSILVAAFVAGSLCATPASAQTNDDEEVVVVKAGRIITVTGDEIERGEIVIIDGKIELVGKRLEYPKSATIIDASTETVMPGLLHAATRYGAPNYGRSGVHANLAAIDDFYLDEIDLEPLLEAGFTAAAYQPPGNGIPGVATVVRLSGAEEDRVLDRRSYIRVTMTNPGRDKRVLAGALKKAQAEIDKVEKARKEWEEKKKKEAEEKAKKEAEEKKKNDGENGGEVSADDPKPDEKEKKEGEGEDGEKKEEKFEPPKIDPAHQPLVDLIQKKDGVFLLIEIGAASDYLHAEDALGEYADRPHHYHLQPSWRSDFHHIVEQLGEADALVMTSPMISRLPDTAVRYNLAGELALAGVKVALTPPNDSWWGIENFRSSIANLTRAGMSRADAAKALALSPWTLVGLDGRFGSIEKGKDADLIFLDRDFLDPSARVTRVMTNGTVTWESEEN